MIDAGNEKHPVSDNAKPDVSVVVPVYEDWAKVPDLLSSLRAQNFDPQSFEIIIVDNGSASVDVPRWQGPPTLKVASCTKPGSYAARNYGVRLARGDVLAFTDADCRPSPDWLANGWRSVCKSADSNRLVAGGVRMVSPPGNHPATAAEKFDLACGIPQARYVRRGYATTANLLMGRATFLDLDGFDERLFSGGDAEFCARAQHSGNELVYVPRAEVDHLARTDFRALAIKTRRLKGGQLAHGSRSQRALWLAKAFVPCVPQLACLARAPQLSWRSRCAAASVSFGLWVVGIAECTRIILGGRPRRR
ncbi:MAG: glycosyltransferase [Spiribacter salinus]|uniref:Glycosyltransferase n=1 Tax=Spiribacter salinus TaxID=1335746 RepID=A0A540VNT7_9GAMM|nr:MAG: glycosyltransferase [Spiribacter salinus]